MKHKQRKMHIQLLKTIFEKIYCCCSSKEGVEVNLFSYNSFKTNNVNNKYYCIHFNNKNNLTICVLLANLNYRRK